MTGLIGKLVPAPAGLLLSAAPYAALLVVSGLAWHFDQRAVANADAVRTQAAQFKQAQAEATAAWNQKFAQEKAADAQLAQENESAHESQLTAAQAAATAFIAAHSVQPSAAGGNAGSATASATDHGASVLAGLPANSVLVSADDVQRCTSAVTYALDAHDYIVERATQK